MNVYCKHVLEPKGVHWCGLDCWVMHFFSDTYWKRYRDPEHCVRCGLLANDDGTMGQTIIGYTANET